jgi:RNA polymerase sigma factor FliA
MHADAAHSETINAAADDEAGWWRRWRERGDADARAAIIDKHVPYARVVAAAYYRRRFHDEIPFDDYLQSARLALLECVDRFDPAMGTSFRTYAARRMHGAILDSVDSYSEKQRQIAATRALRAERAESLCHAGDNGSDDLFRRLADVSVGLALSIMLDGTAMAASDATACPHAESPYQRRELQQLRQQIQQLVEALPEAEKRVVKHHYLQSIPFDAIAKSMNLTKGRISQIHRAALQRLRQLIAQREACDVAF